MEGSTKRVRSCVASWWLLSSADRAMCNLVVILLLAGATAYPDQLPSKPSAAAEAHFQFAGTWREEPHCVRLWQAQCAWTGDPPRPARKTGRHSVAEPSVKLSQGWCAVFASLALRCCARAGLNLNERRETALEASGASCNPPFSCGGVSRGNGPLGPSKPVAYRSGSLGRQSRLRGDTTALQAQAGGCSGGSAVGESSGNKGLSSSTEAPPTRCCRNKHLGRSTSFPIAFLAGPRPMGGSHPKLCSCQRVQPTGQACTPQAPNPNEQAPPAPSGTRSRFGGTAALQAPGPAGPHSSP